jgi:hypothetical protein
MDLFSKPSTSARPFAAAPLSLASAAAQRGFTAPRASAPTFRMPDHPSSHWPDGREEEEAVPGASVEDTSPLFNFPQAVPERSNVIPGARLARPAPT